MSNNLTKQHSELPVRAKLDIYYLFSLIIALLVGGASLIGIIYSSVVFPTEDLHGFMVTDVINLTIILPLLILSLYLARAKKLIGLLFWPGAILMITYHYLSYVLGTPFSWLSILYYTILAGSIYLLIGLVSTIDGEKIRSGLSGLLFEKLLGWVLIIFGGYMLYRFYGFWANSLLKQQTMPASESAVIITDFLLSPPLIICGLLLLKKKALGYVGAVALYLKMSMLCLGLLLLFILSPIMTGISFAAVDFIVIAIFTVIFNIPLALIIRSVVRNQGNV